MFHLESVEEKGEPHYEQFSNNYDGQRYGLSDGGNDLLLL